MRLQSMNPKAQHIRSRQDEFPHPSGSNMRACRMGENDDQMMKSMTTNVRGLFNPNPYRINVVISEPGCSVQLNPMEFILERGTGRKINDPILDHYVGYKMLSPEISDTPMPVIAIPRIAASQPSPLVAGQVNPSVARLP